MRWKLRGLMTLVAALAAVFAYGLRFTRVDARSRSFVFRRIEGARLARSMQVALDQFGVLAREAEKDRESSAVNFAAGHGKNAALALECAAYHRSLMEKYNFASRYPFLPVLPDGQDPCPSH
jgi:hypothetical protein